MIDFSINDKQYIQNDEIGLILQQIDILFDTEPKSVLGQEKFGSQYDKYLYKLNMSNEDLKYHVLSDINQLELFGYQPKVEVYMFQGTERDIAVVEITLIKDQNKYTQLYKIS